MQPRVSRKLVPGVIESQKELIHSSVKFKEGFTMGLAHSVYYTERKRFATQMGLKGSQFAPSQNAWSSTSNGSMKS
jgi:hypothetical protein